MEFLAILLTFLALTLAYKNECSEYYKISRCCVKCYQDLVIKLSLENPCITEASSKVEMWKCYCSFSEKQFELLGGCKNKCDKVNMYPKNTPVGLRRELCSSWMAPLGYKSSVNVLHATATEPGEYLLSGTYVNGSPWYRCHTVKERNLSTLGTITITNFPKKSGSSDDKETIIKPKVKLIKSSSSETKTTTNSSRFSGFSLMTLILIAFL